MFAVAEDVADVSRSFATSIEGPAAEAIAAVRLPFKLGATVCPAVPPTVATDSSNSFLTLQ